MLPTKRILKMHTDCRIVARVCFRFALSAIAITCQLTGVSGGAQLAADDVFRGDISGRTLQASEYFVYEPVNNGPKPAAPLIATPEPSETFSIVGLILDEQASDQERTEAINQHPELAADIITAMVSDLEPGTQQESSRIPWIWKVAVNVVEQDDPELIARVLDVSLPQDNEPLAPWQAVVVGGGIVNGLSQQGAWPADKINEIVAEDALLQQRWERAIRLSSGLIEDRSYPAGTRYDALRIVAMQPWQNGGPTLTAMMQSNVEPELQLGAVSGAIDSPHPESGRVLIQSMDALTPANRQLAIGGLFRTRQRVRLLRNALRERRISANWLTPEQLRTLQR